MDTELSGGRWRPLALFVYVVALALFLNAAEPVSQDFLAFWLAGRAYAAGDPGAIYSGTAPSGIFTMEAPASWASDLNAMGYHGDIFPFIYPPLWAWIASKVVEVGDFRTAETVISLSNALLVAVMPVLAMRIADARGGAVPFLILGGAICLAATASRLALIQNQAQILLSFLVLLAVERSERGAPWVAGVSLALAASIKVYPCLFALIWMARRRRSEAAAFATAGAALTAISVAVAGWPLHQAFLRELAAISRTALVNQHTFSFDAFAGRLLMDSSAMRFMDTAAFGGNATWAILRKSFFWRLTDIVALAIVLFALWQTASRARGSFLIWPAAFVLLALVSPLSWIYHFLTAIVFLPALLSRLGLAAGLGVTAAVVVPASNVSVMLAELDPAAASVFYWLESAALVGMGILFLVLTLMERPAPHP